MSKFKYRVRDGAGKLVEGVKEAGTQQQLVDTLRASGYFILDIEEKKSPESAEARPKAFSSFRFQKGVKTRDIIVFTRQLATMIHAGVPFVDSLSVIGEQTEKIKFKAVINEVTKEVRAGSFFSKAIAKYPNLFNQLYVSMIEVGESGGVLEDVLNRLVFIMERDEETKLKIKSAFTYPVIVVLIVFFVVGFLTTFVFPKFIAIFQNAGVKLPLPTKILFGTSIILKKTWFIELGIIIGFIYMLGRYRKTAIGRYTTDRLILSIPLVGNLIRKLVLGRFTRTLATLYSTGVPILRSLEIVERGITNAVLLRIIRKIREDVRQGKSLAKPMSNYKEFPPMMVQMIAVGEETGSISDMLNEVSNAYEIEVEYAVKNITTAIEPLLILFMGVIVGLTALSLFLPMFDMMKLVH